LIIFQHFTHLREPGVKPTDNCYPRPLAQTRFPMNGSNPTE
jgi:hypothetical protein